jgi:hypothetical protein
MQTEAMPMSADLTLAIVFRQTGSRPDWGALWAHANEGVGGNGMWGVDFDIVLRTNDLSNDDLSFMTANSNGVADLAFNTDTPYLMIGTMAGGTAVSWELNPLVYGGGVGQTVQSYTVAATIVTTAAQPVSIGGVSNPELGLLAANFYAGEVIYYQRVLSAGELTTLRTYLTAKWLSPQPPSPPPPSPPPPSPPFLQTPLVPGGLVQWLDGADQSVTTFLPAGSPTAGVSVVTSIANKGSGGGSYTPTSAAARPLYGGATCPLQFDGADTELTGTAFTTWLDGGATLIMAIANFAGGGLLSHSSMPFTYPGQSVVLMPANFDPLNAPAYAQGPLPVFSATPYPPTLPAERMLLFLDRCCRRCSRDQQMRVQCLRIHLALLSQLLLPRSQRKQRPPATGGSTRRRQRRSLSTTPL